MTEKIDEAVAGFSSGKLNCAQAVLSAYSQDLGLDRKTAVKLAAGFGSGMRSGEVCGAVTGALMVIGLKYGDCQDKTNSLTREFITRFKKQNTSIICRELLKLDKDKDTQKTGTKKLHCTKMVQDAAAIIEDIISKN